jgi:hypothetical protein
MGALKKIGVFSVDFVEFGFYYRSVFIFFQLKLLNEDKSVSQHKLARKETESMKQALESDYINGNIRLREGEYQYSLAKTIAAFQLEQYFPDVKDITKTLYGEEKITDIQFIRKIQTILKKMEKSNIVKILPKKKPWELQRYMLSSFKFRDSDKNLVTFATEQEINQARNLLNTTLNQGEPAVGPVGSKFQAGVLILIILASYAAILWNLTQPVINPIVFIPAFSIAIVCSIVLGKVLSRR